MDYDVYPSFICEPDLVPHETDHGRSVAADAGAASAPACTEDIPGWFQQFSDYRQPVNSRRTPTEKITGSVTEIITGHIDGATQPVRFDESIIPITLSMGAAQAFSCSRHTRLSKFDHRLSPAGCCVWLG